MPISDDMRRLEVKWKGGTGWPKRLDWIEIDGLRGWRGERFKFQFPIMALVGENGVGKTTVLQAAAAVHRPPGARPGTRQHNASWFFPDTAWERIENAAIRYHGREGTRTISNSVRKPTERWRGYNERPERPILYIDLGRIQPVTERTGYSKLAKAGVTEISSDMFDEATVSRLSNIMGRHYEHARMSLTTGDSRREVPVLGANGLDYSGFHQGAGETVITELLVADFPKNGIVLIDEIESSLHPRAQRRLMRDLAAICREREVQILLTTHSPYVLDELPLEARACIILNESGREIVYGVTPEFAMTRMDDVPHYECDVYVEDVRAKTFLQEIIVAHRRDLIRRCQVIPFGAASVGRSLGQMVANGRFPRPTRVFLDGDESPSTGCLLLPGDDAPERVVFRDLLENSWLAVSQRVGRPISDLADACSSAMLLGDHHEWVSHAANILVVGGVTLWQAMCAEWAEECLPAGNALRITQPIEDAMSGIEGSPPPPTSELPTIPTMANRPSLDSSSGQGRLF